MLSWQTWLPASPTYLMFSSNEGAHTGSTKGHLKQADHQLSPRGRLAGQAGYLTLHDRHSSDHEAATAAMTADMAVAAITAVTVEMAD